MMESTAFFALQTLKDVKIIKAVKSDIIFFAIAPTLKNLFYFDNRAGRFDVSA